MGNQLSRESQMLPWLGFTVTTLAPESIRRSAAAAGSNTTAVKGVSSTSLPLTL